MLEKRGGQRDRAGLDASDQRKMKTYGYGGQYGYDGYAAGLLFEVTILSRRRIDLTPSLSRSRWWYR